MKTYTIVLNEAHLQALSDALMMLPYGKAAPVVDEINKQIHNQNKELAETQKLNNEMLLNK